MRSALQCIWQWFRGAERLRHICLASGFVILTALSCTATEDVIGAGPKLVVSEPGANPVVDPPDAAEPQSEPPVSIPPSVAGEDGSAPLVRDASAPQTFDSGATEASDARAPLSLPPFGVPEPIAGFDRSDDPSATQDGLELYFDGAAGTTIFTAKRSALDQTWGPASIVTAPDFDGAGTTPWIAPDGLELFFASAGADGLDVLSLRRENRAAAWQAPLPVPGINWEGDDYAPALSGSQLEMVVTRFRGGLTSEDLFISSRPSVTASWAEPELLALSEPARKESDAVFGAGDLELWFVAGTEEYGQEIFMAKRPSKSEPFAPGERVVELSSAGHDHDPWISHDGREIMFISSRLGVPQLYRATR